MTWEDEVLRDLCRSSHGLDTAEIKILSMRPMANGNRAAMVMTKRGVAT